jgi:hypothetical protein
VKENTHGLVENVVMGLAAGIVIQQLVKRRNRKISDQDGGAMANFTAEGFGEVANG